jgi:hypothetical protein
VDDAQVSVVDSTLIHVPAPGIIGAEVISFTVQDNRGRQKTANVESHVLATGALAVFDFRPLESRKRSRNQFYAGAIPGNSYYIMVSTDLLYWELLMTVVAIEEGLLQSSTRKFLAILIGFTERKR